MRKPSKINQYFKRKNAEANTKSPNIKNSQVSLTNSPNFRNPPLKSQRIETNPVNTQLLERDPGLRPQIWVYDINQRDEICRAYIMAGPYQPRLSEYPKSGPEKHLRCFQSSWFDSFPSWLEYSPIKDAAFCLPCYLFNTPSAHPKCNAYTVNGFNVWRKVKDGINCAFLNHVGKDPNSTHKKAEKSCEDLMRQSQHLPQRNEELKRAQAADIEYMISIDELESGATCSVLLNIIEDGTNAFQRGDADAAYEAMTSFEFVFILHLMKEIMAITDILCQALQSKSQDILHAMHLVSSTKALMQKFRDNGWITLLNQVKSFCEARNIDISEMNAHYVAR
ncbi:TTF-type domain-containing protein [Citrus sinensis]|uniref:TTF-type domain-containing protein n=1 Tax=Citrus sinensis TaxID=2711 RepID=A0ACB8IJA7_CITSI|nr:TTF-type domain-containing protein [Citrus sinensis]